MKGFNLFAGKIENSPPIVGDGRPFTPKHAVMQVDFGSPDEYRG